MGRLKLWFERLLVGYWAWREHPVAAEGGPPDARQPTDNVMRAMSLVMPLADTTAVGRAQAAAVIASGLDEIYSGLDNVGTVHFARFVIVDDNLLMFSYYDGDFHTYIRDFIVTLGHAFDAIVNIVRDPPTTPCKEHVDEFIDWVHRHDLYQLPDDVTEIADDLSDVRALSRVLALRMHTNPNVLLGAYRGYPGYSVAQVREHLGMGW
jgi:hypothetical protein